jgi:hypothetical protein
VDWRPFVRCTLIPTEGITFSRSVCSGGGDK